MKTAKEIAREYSALEICEGYDGETCGLDYDCSCHETMSAIRAIIRDARNEALEEAARMVKRAADNCMESSKSSYENLYRDIARMEQAQAFVLHMAEATIRALKEPTP